MPSDRSSSTRSFEETYKDVDSRMLFRDAMERIRAKGFGVSNLDVIVHAEAPKMSPYKRPMAESIAKLAGVAVDRVNVKAKTNEGVGPLGHADAIACTAAALMVSSNDR